MLFKGQTEGFPGYRLFHLQFFLELGYGGGADHLVLYPVAQVCLAHVKRYPPEYVLCPCLGQDVGDAVAQAQVGAYRSGKVAVKDGEDVGSSAADVYAHDIYTMSPGLILYNYPYCGRGRHDGGGGPCHEFLIAGGVGHDVFQEEVLYLLSGGHQVLSLQGGSQIFGYLEVGTLFQYLADGISCVLVSGVEDREFKGGA